MKKEHLEILERIYDYLSQPGSDQLRFGQALMNLNIVEETPENRDHLSILWNSNDKYILKKMKQ